MKPATNVYYVKKYDKNGNVSNPINSGYLHSGDNRSIRRAQLPTRRFIGNGKNLPLTVINTVKFIRHIQREYDKDGNHKLIYHYLPR